MQACFVKPTAEGSADRCTEICPPLSYRLSRRLKRMVIAQSKE